MIEKITTHQSEEDSRNKYFDLCMIEKITTHQSEEDSRNKIF